MAFEFVLRSPQDDSGQIIPLPVGEYNVGQAAENGIVLVHPFVAGSHAQLAVTDEAVWITDLGSQAGTLVNNLRLRPQQPTRLKIGDMVEVAWFQLTLQETAVSIASPSEPIETSSHSDDSENDSQKKDLPNPEPGYWETAKELGFYKEFSRYMQYLPAIYDTPFIHRFLGVFESLLAPIVWRIDNLDLFLDGTQTTEQFLPWLANWYTVTFDQSWTESQRRQLLQAAPEIFGWWGTARALKTVLNIFLEQAVTIVDDETLPPFTFRVEIPLPPDKALQAAVSRLINQHKPAQTSFELTFTG